MCNSSEVPYSPVPLRGGSEVPLSPVPPAAAARSKTTESPQRRQRGPKRPSPTGHQKRPRGLRRRLAMQAFGPFPRLGAKLAGGGPVLYREPLHARLESKPVRRIYERRSEKQTRD